MIHYILFLLMSLSADAFAVGPLNVGKDARTGDGRYNRWIFVNPPNKQNPTNCTTTDSSYAYCGGTTAVAQSMVWIVERVGENYIMHGTFGMDLGASATSHNWEINGVSFNNGGGGGTCATNFSGSSRKDATIGVIQSQLQMECSETAGGRQFYYGSFFAKLERKPAWLNPFAQNGLYGGTENTRY